MSPKGGAGPRNRSPRMPGINAPINLHRRNSMQRRIILTLFTLILLIGLALLGVNLFDTTQASMSTGGWAAAGSSLMNASGTARMTPTALAMMTANGCGVLSFSATSNPGALSYPFSVAAGDFNGDGKLDLAVANVDSDNVSILLGNGTGGFGPAANFGVGDGPNSMVVGDFNADNKLDIATANYFSSDVSILLGDGTGGFGAAADVGAGVVPYTVADGGWHGDHKRELA